MMMLEQVRDERASRDVMMTHDTEGDPPRPQTHVIRFYEPNPAGGAFAGKLVGSYRLSDRQAKELKNHL